MAQRDFPTRVRRRAARAGVVVPDALLLRLDVYFTLLSRWNEKINLTALTDLDEAVDRLILEPLVAARHVAPAARVLMDVGSGGGSPAVPLALALPRLTVTMVESKVRKSAFLREVIRQLDLDAQVETARVEELLPRAELHEAADVLSIRAVRVEGRMLHTLQAFLAPGGQLLLFRGPSGPDAPAAVVPPLAVESTYSLIDTMQSRLTVLRKRQIGFGA